MDSFSLSSYSSSLSMKVILSNEDLLRLKDILVYIKCIKCTEIMTEPKMCLSCNKNLCNKCHKSTCNHELIMSRHLKTVLKSMKFKCRGCKSEEEYDYFSLSKHAESCFFFKNLMKEKIKEKSNEKHEKDEGNLNIKVKEYSFKEKIIENMSKIKEIVCSCGKIFDDNENNNFNKKEEYKKHKYECLINTSDTYKNDCLLKDKLIEEFTKNIETVQNRLYSLYSNKNNDMINSILNDLDSFSKLIEQKKEEIVNKENDILKYSKELLLNKDYIPSSIIEENIEYNRLIQEENKLKQENQRLELEYERIKNEFLLEKIENDKELNELYSTFKGNIMNLEIEESILKEEISNTDHSILNNVLTENDVCSLCKSTNSKTEKFYCYLCCKRYCINICAKHCSSSNCSNLNKLICPLCTPKCGLCRKNVFCEDCKMKCFYLKCKNTFCPDCFSKNSYRKRESNVNCNVVNCENDNNKPCIMTSLYCVKCNKRLCNDCLFNDKDHFSSIFK